MAERPPLSVPTESRNGASAPGGPLVRRLRYSTVVGATALLFLSVYVLSNTTSFHQVGVLYYGRHLALVAVAFLGMVWWFERSSLLVPWRYVVFGLVVYLIAAPYFVRFVLSGELAELGAFLQHVIFAAAVLTLGVALERARGASVSRIVFLLLALTLAVAAWAALTDPAQLYNTHWGRPRLLLGFFHPKQLGTLLATVALLTFTLAALHVGRRLNLLVYFALLVLLLLVDSRNMLLFPLLFGISYLVAAKGGYVSLLTLWVAGAATVGWLVLRYPLLMDLLTSGRLSIWKAADYSALGSGTRVSDAGATFERFHIDNYYVAYAIENGLYALVLVPALLVLIGYLLFRTPDVRWRRLKVAAASSFLFVCVWDAGMFSTGNLVNLAVWTYLLAGERIFPRAAEPAERRLHDRRIVPAPAVPA